MLKRLFSFIITLSLCLCVLPLHSFAAEPINVPKTMSGYLTDDEGNVEIATGHLVDVPKTCADSDNVSATYAFDLYRSGKSITVDDTSAGASTVYLTINLSSTSYNGMTLYCLDSVEGYWTISDSSVSVKSTYLTYGCSAIFPKPKNQTGSRSVGNDFYVSTGFNSYAEPYMGAIGATWKLTYQMGSTRTWTFTLQNNL